MRKRISLCHMLILTLGVLVFSVCDATAQVVTGTIVGTVKDQSGAIVPGAKITIVNVGTESIRNVVADSSGDYTAPSLPIGEYRLTAEREGFKKTVVSGISLEVNQTPRIDIVLAIGNRAESVQVIGSAPLMKTESSDIGTVVDSHEVVDIPLNGRMILDLNLLDASAARLSNYRNDAAGPNGQDLGGAGMSFNGSSVDGNGYLVDGVQSEGMQTTHMTYQPTLESVQEFQQESNQYNAAFGFGGGAQINVVTKSGTNTFHGQAYEYVRNDIFDARNFFDTTRPAYRHNQFGGVFGGPIIKDKTFFFFSYEGNYIRKAIGQLYTVPPMAEREGNFSADATIYDPATTVPDPANPGEYLRTPFSGNVIPLDRLDPVAQKAYQYLFPLPNLPGESANLEAAPDRIENRNQYDVRVDHRFNSSHAIFGRYTKYDNNMLLNSFCSLPNCYDIVDNPSPNNLTVGYTALISPTKVNELRVGWTTWQQILEPQSGRLGTKTDYHALLGLGAPPNGVPAIQLGLPTIGISGYDGTGGQLGAPNNRNDNNYQIVDNLNLTEGNHQISTGGAVRLWRENHAGINLFVRGDYSFSSQYTSNPEVGGTGDPLADFDLGYPVSDIGGEGDSSQPYSRNLTAAYVQDNWKVRPNLTLNLGVRWEYFGPWYEPNGALTFFSFQTAQIVTTQQIEQEGLGKSGYTVPKDNVAPRIGLAWRPFGDNKTAVRTGFGMFHLPHTQLYELLGLNPNPLAGYFSWTADPTYPNLTLEDPFPTGGGVTGAPSPYAVQPHWKTPYNMQWSMFVQRELRPNLSLELGYVGNRGVDLEQAPDLNTPAAGPGSLASRRLYPNFGSIETSQSLGNSWYNALEVNLERKWQNGFSFRASYTYSKGLSDVDLGAFAFQGGLGFNGDPFDVARYKGRTEFDARHRLALSYIYELPYGRGRRYGSASTGVVDAFLGGWQVNGITTIDSGSPVDTGLAFNNMGPTAGGWYDRPDLIANPNDGPKTAQEWFNTSAFALAPTGTYGNAARNIVEAPGIANWDFSIFKNFRLTERQRLQFRAELFNIFNTPQFDPPNTTFGSPSFGEIFSAGDGREIQFALKYSF